MKCSREINERELTGLRQRLMRIPSHKEMEEREEKLPHSSKQIFYKKRMGYE